MITLEKIEEWRMKANHYNIRDNPRKLKGILLEVLDAVNEARDTTDVQAPDKVRRNSKKKP